jgi:hypothetical protein
MVVFRIKSDYQIFTPCQPGAMPMDWVVVKPGLRWEQQLQANPQASSSFERQPGV